MLSPVRAAGPAVVVATALALGACSSSGHDARPASSGESATVQISVSHCGQGWASGRSGWQSFTLQDSDSRAAEVTLVDPGSGAVFATLDPLGPGRTAALAVQLGPGRYAFRCAVEDEPVVTGPAVTVRGATIAAAARGVLPVTQQDLIPATLAYTRYVAGRLPALERDVHRLSVDLAAHRRATAERDWLTAHLDYERLGAAYGAFGDADGAINGLPTGGPEGLQDRSFTGFHRVELDLWHGRPLSVVAAEAAALAQQVAGLRTVLRSAQIDPLDVSIRAHEITENALEFELTGRTDFGSHSALATIDANLQGTRTVLGFVDPLLQSRYAGLARATSALGRADADVRAQRHNGRWTGLAALPQPARERIDSDVSELTELLAPIAQILEPRRDT